MHRAVLHSTLDALEKYNRVRACQFGIEFNDICVCQQLVSEVDDVQLHAQSTRQKFDKMSLARLRRPVQEKTAAEWNPSVNLQRRYASSVACSSVVSN